MPQIEFQDGSRFDFNPNHNASNGQFASKGGGGRSGWSTPAKNPNLKDKEGWNIKPGSGPSGKATSTTGSVSVSGKAPRDLHVEISKYLTGTPNAGGHVGVFSDRKMAAHNALRSKDASVYAHPETSHIAVVTNRYGGKMRKAGFKEVGISTYAKWADPSGGWSTPAKNPNKKDPEGWNVR